MSGEFSPPTIEAKWQAYWDANKTFRTPNPGDPDFDPSKKKYYVLDMFPYPSGAGLHVGHPEGYTATDIIARYRRMNGYNVLHTMGWDAFGLPAEQHAIDTGQHPAVTTERNINNFRRQLKMLGFSYDWDREISTTDPNYYRWTQWIFLQIFNSWYDDDAKKARPIAELPIPDDVKARGEKAVRAFVDSKRLAYLAEVPVNWCPALGTVLANEEVTNEGRSERGNYPVYRRPLKQWMLRITKYADRLEQDLAELDWPESVKLMQRNWIGRSEGAVVRFEIEQSTEQSGTEQSRDHKEAVGVRGEGSSSFGNRFLEIFTTRPDTLFGATYMVLAPEHPLVEQITTEPQRDAVRAYVSAAANKTDLDRTADTKKKTGVFTGAFAINPANNERIPIWVADYVLMSYGTGAIMAVPGQDQRDWDFAKAYDLPIIRTVQTPPDFDGEAYLEDGPAINSDFLDGLNVADAKRRMIEWLEERGLGRGTVTYKLRDWLFSRQRYWGEPFPILHGPDGEIVALDEKELPLTLPEMIDFRPTVEVADAGSSHASSPTSQASSAVPEPPLGRAKDWVPVERHGKTYRRELNTMPQWAGSCWYYLRFLDPHNRERFCGADAEHYWMVSNRKDGRPHVGGVDLYLGGAEHAVLHLLYARFWHKVLYDLGYVSTPEPFGKLFNQGMIRAFAYKDSRDTYVGYDDIDFREDGAYHRTTGEKLVGAVEKMSKSMKNVINPEEVVNEYGGDSLRLYEMFMGPLEASKPWNPRDVPGVHRFLQRAWRMIVNEQTGELAAMVVEDGSKPELNTLERTLHKTIRKVGEDIDRMAFNTAISAMMEFVNEAYRTKAIGKSQAERFVLLLSVFAPHIGEELWQRLRGDMWRGSAAYEAWPAWDPAMVEESQVEIPVQVNGKMAGRLTVAKTADEATVMEAALADEKIRTRVGGGQVVKTIYVPGRMLNLIVK